MRNFIVLLLFVSCARIPHLYKTDFSSQDELKLCFIGDSGTGSKEQGDVASALGSEKCHKIFILGDLIYPNGISDINDPQLKTKFLDFYLPLTKKDFRPTITVIMGNHDYRNNPKAWFDVAKTYPEIIYPDLYFTQIIGSTCIVALDTNLLRFIQKYGQASEQSSWLDQQNDRLNNQCKTKIAISHHPYLSSGKHHGPATGIIKLFFQQKVLGKFNYLISGHEHVLTDEGVENGTRLLISGAAGNTDKGFKPGYIVVKVKNNESSYSVIEL